VDDNENSLPGPVWSTAKASYDKNSSAELIYYLAPYLSLPHPTSRMEVADSFVCSGFLRRAPDLNGLAGRKVWVLNDDVDPSPLNRVRPFGYPASSTTPDIRPMSMSSFDTYVSPSSIYAMTDLDQSLPNIVPNSDWYPYIPKEPVHGSVRNALFFDWHVEGVRW
jgi:prepilin-type processing-associated H-X9-DG protein